MGEKIREHLKKFREAAGLTQKQLGAMAGKGESAIQAYESGKSDIPLSALISIMGALKISFADLERGSKTEPPAEKPVEILIYNQEDRLNTAAILVKNGYTVEQGKRNKTPTGKALDYFCEYESMTRPPIPADRRAHEQITIFKNKGRRGGGRDEQIRETVQPETERCTGEKPAVPENGKQREVGSGDVFQIKDNLRVRCAACAPGRLLSAVGIPFWERSYQ